MTSADVVIDSLGAKLTGGGTIGLSSNSTNLITGPGILTNGYDRIQGSGLLGGGGLNLVNDAGGIIEALGSASLTLDTATKTITNAGELIAGGSAGLNIAGALDITGMLTVNAGVLNAERAVSGAGSVRINAGLAEFDSAFAENVAFGAGSRGQLKLAEATAYTGAVSGLSKTGANSLDLADIAFRAGDKVSYSGTGTSGVLTVTDGSNTATIKLVGNYTISTFAVSSDGSGGVVIVAGPTPAAAHVFLAAMANLAPTASGAETIIQGGGRLTHPILGAPR